jgi:hypothetical protein
MMYGVRELLGYDLLGTDGQIGNLHEFYFSDEDWDILYLVAGRGRLLPGRKVLISPLVVHRPHKSSRIVELDISQEQIRAGSAATNQHALCHHMQIQLSRYYGWADYAGRVVMAEAELNEKSGSVRPLLRAIGEEVLGSSVQAVDGKIGHVEDCIVDDETWIIRYLVVRSTDPSRDANILLSPQWIDTPDWQVPRFHVGFTLEAIRNSPEYDPCTPLTRDCEEKLYSFFGRLKYWI